MTTIDPSGHRGDDHADRSERSHTRCGRSAGLVVRRAPYYCHVAWLSGQPPGRGIQRTLDRDPVVPVFLELVALLRRRRKSLQPHSAQTHSRTPTTKAHAERSSDPREACPAPTIAKQAVMATAPVGPCYR
jgi:hypothetical protein